MSGEFKGAPGPWFRDNSRAIGPKSTEDDQSYGMVIPVGWVEFNPEIEVQVANQNIMVAAPELLEALQWAFPMAIIAMEQHRMERVKNGHMDISGTYKNGESWVGIYQDEIDKIEFSRAAIAKALGEPQ